MGETSQNMGYSNKIRVTGTNHADQPGGKFFNFELRKTDLPWEPCGELPDGTPFGEVRLKVWNSRTEREHDVVAWDAPNGGERQGDAHGRCEPDDDEEVFEGGDKLYIIEPKRMPSKIKVIGTNHASDEADGVSGKFFNFWQRKAEIEFAPCGELPDGTPFGDQLPGAQLPHWRGVRRCGLGRPQWWSW